MSKKSKYGIVDVYWESGDTIVQVVKIPDGDIDNKLSFIPAQHGISKIEYEAYLVNKCLVDLESLVFLINMTSSSIEEEFQLQSELASIVVDVNPLLSPELIVMSESGRLKIPDINDDKVKRLVKNSRWDDIYINNASDLVDNTQDILNLGMFNGSDTIMFEEFNSNSKAAVNAKVVTKEWEAAGLVLEIRKFKEKDIKELFEKNSNFIGPKSYESFVISRCTPNYSRLMMTIETRGITRDVNIDSVMKTIYDFCVQVNPALKFENALKKYITVNKVPKVTKPTRRNNISNINVKETSKKDTKKKTVKGEAKSFSSVTNKELIELPNVMKKHIIGQNEAIDRISESIQIAGTGLSNPNRPIGSFLLTGESGIGKTLTAKVLAQHLCGDINSLVHIDCSEFAQPHETAKLIGCFVPGTTVTMAGGLVKPIEDVVVGDEVISHTGTVKRVKDKFKYDCEGDLVKINYSGDNRTIKCTPQHEFLVVKSDKCWYTHRSHVTCRETCSKTKNKGDICSNQLFKNYKPKWVHARDLKVGDFVMQPRYKSNRSRPEVLDIVDFMNKNEAFSYDDAYVWMDKRPSNKVKRHIEVNENFARLAGYYVSEGGSYRKYADFSFHLDEVKYQKEVEKLLYKVFKKKCKFSRPPGEVKIDKKRSRARINNIPAATLFHKLFSGNGAENKVLPSWWLDLPENLLKGFITTAIFGDGCAAIKRRVDYSTVSPNLATQIRNIIHKLGFSPTMSLEAKKKSSNEQPRYRIYISGNQITEFCNKLNGIEVKDSSTVSSIQRKMYSDADYTYREIKNLDTEYYEGPVYDMHVEEDMSYQVLDIIAHNSPPGYIGHDSGGFLTNKIMENPFSVILFDEIEKAHSKLFNILLQLLEEGHMTDGKGTVVDFSDCVILLTSNIGVRNVASINKTVGFGDVGVITQKKKTDKIEKSIKRKFRPEFLNRLDDTITFNSLGKKEAEKIVDLSLKELLVYTKNKGVTLKVQKSAKKFILNKGFSKEYGARAIKRTIDKEIIKPLAIRFLKNKIKSNSTVTAEYKNKKMLFKSKELTKKTKE
jgi:DNA polymerase III delta prime subunit